MRVFFRLSAPEFTGTAGDINILLSVKGQVICVYTISPFLELWHLKSCQKCILKMLDMSLLDSEGRYIVSK